MKDFGMSCYNCKHEHLNEYEYPCKNCNRSDGEMNNWEIRPDACNTCSFSKGSVWCDGCIVKAMNDGLIQVNDPVNHPSHYTKGNIEVADFIADQKLNFDRGNAVKYVCRAGSKDPEKEIQDLEKAIWYIEHEIKMLKGETENGNSD